MSDSKTILIVDDEEAIRQSFVDHFEDQLWETIQAESAEDALDLLDDHQPDAAIVDIRLKGMNGDLFIRGALKKSPALVYLICTGSPEYDVPEDLLKLPNVASQVFRKPVMDISEIEDGLIELLKACNPSNRSE